MATISMTPPAFLTTPPKPAWNPVALDINARASWGGDVLLAVDEHVTLAGDKPKPSTVDAVVTENGKMLQEVHKTAPISPAERTAAAAVRDALIASNFLKDAKQASAPLGPDQVRIGVTAADGQVLSLDVPLTPDSPPGYEAFGTALKAYNELTALNPE